MSNIYGDNEVKCNVLKIEGSQRKGKRDKIWQISSGAHVYIYGANMTFINKYAGMFPSSTKQAIYDLIIISDWDNWTTPESKAILIHDWNFFQNFILHNRLELITS